jgi:hypothetical protein
LAGTEHAHTCGDGSAPAPRASPAAGRTAAATLPPPAAAEPAVSPDAPGAIGDGTTFETLTTKTPAPAKSP